MAIWLHLAPFLHTQTFLLAPASISTVNAPVHFPKSSHLPEPLPQECHCLDRSSPVPNRDPTRGDPVYSSGGSQSSVQTPAAPRTQLDEASQSFTGPQPLGKGATAVTFRSNQTGFYTQECSAHLKQHTCARTREGAVDLWASFSHLMLSKKSPRNVRHAGVQK